MTKWFHNLWLDTARTSGIIPLAILIISNLYVLKKAFTKNKINNIFFELNIIASTIIIMSQDVIIENNIRIFIIFYFSSLILITKSKPKNV
jgi:hypothetical protein